jgi:cytochrome c oxidase assembly protein subunit 15
MGNIFYEFMSKKTIRKLLPVLIFVTFCLISLGGAVRAMHAGLSCPDWPLCFGAVIPDYQVQVYYEFIHRTIAGLVAIGTVILAFGVFRGKDVPKETKLAMVFAILVLMTQIIMGGLTVLKLLHFGIVTAHLGFGMAFFSLLIWMYFSISEHKSRAAGTMPKTFFGIALFAFAMVYAQVLLGGLVSSNYAGLACPEFPLCEGEFLPTFEGLVGLQVIHRLGAYLVAITIVSLYLLASKNREQKWMDKRYYNICGALVIAVIVQIAVGICNVLFKTPPLITVIHLAVAATILALVLRLLYIAKMQTRIP